MQFSPDQSSAIEASRLKNLSIISGPPGSGKTALIAELSKRENVLLLAPTGASADRVAQSTGSRAHVVDKVLFDTDIVKFVGKHIVLDEAGMLSTDGLERIHRFLKPKSIVLIGDIKQLPCVEGFSALGTLMAMPSVPKTLLVTLWRRSGHAEAALDRCLLSLGTPAFDPNDQDQSFQIVECRDQNDAYDRASVAFKEKPSQMIAYTNAAVKKLNEATESEQKIVKGTTRVSDRVVCVKNHYVKKILKVANGTCGEAHERFVLYDNDYKDLKLETQFEPCRTLTVNKSQGSEYDAHGIVVLAPWMGDPPLELLYTAISRFKVSVTVYGTRNLVNRAFAAKFANVVDEKLITAVFDLNQ